MQQHQQILANAVTLRLALPQAGPLTQNIRRPRSTPTYRLVDAELHLNNAGIRTPDGYHLPRKNNIGLVRELMQNIDHCLRRRRGSRRDTLPRSQRSREQHRKRNRTQTRRSSLNPAHASLPLPVFRQEEGAKGALSEFSTLPGGNSR
jgi:hypothetical protein